MTNLSRLCYLNVDNNRIKDFSPLTNLTALTGLSLSRNPIEDYSALGSLERLTTLRLENNYLKETNLTFLGKLSQLTFLSLNHNQISDLSSLGGLAKLNDLYLRRNRLSSIEAVEFLPSLLNVDVALNFLNLNESDPPWDTIQDMRHKGITVRCEPQNTAPGFTGLLWNQRLLIYSPGPKWYIPSESWSSLSVSLWENPLPADNELTLRVSSSDSNLVSLVTDILPGTNYTRTLTVQSGNPAGQPAMLTLTVTDDVLLTASTNIEVVVLPNTNIMSLCGKTASNLLAGVASRLGKPAEELTPADFLMLNSLAVQHASLEDSCAWKWLTNLTTLSLSGKSVSNLTALTALAQLTSLDLGDVSVTDFSPLAGLSSLTSVSLSGGTMSDLSSLTNLAHLSSLALFNTVIPDYAPLAGIPSLTNLALYGESISNLSGLAHVTQLTSLALYNGRVTDLSPLSALTNLTILSLNGAAIYELSFLTNLTRLVSLNLGHNHITNLAPLKVLTDLKNLSLRRNRLSSINTLESLPGLANVDLGLNLLDLTAAGRPWEVIQGLLLNGVNVTYLPTNQPPGFATFWSHERPLVFSPGPTWFIPANTTSSLSAYVYEELWPDDSELVVTASSSNPGVVLLPTNALPGTNYTRTLNVRAGDAANQPLTITLTVTDDVLLASSTNIEVVVLPNTSILSLCTNVDLKLADAIAFWSDKPVGDLTPVDLLMLKSLSIENANVGDWCVWQWLTNLTALSLSGISNSNLGLLTQLGQLTSLALFNTSVSDPAPLRSLGNLTNLSLYGETIGDLNFLTNLTQLTSLAVSNGQAGDFSFLQELTNLTDLSCLGNPILDVSFLTNLMALNSLTLFKTRVADLSSLAGLTNLQFLHLQHNRITNLWCLKDLPQLIYADVRLNLIDTRSNSPGLLSIDSLTSRGVIVSNEPQRELVISIINTNWVIAGARPSWLYFSVLDNGWSSDLSVAATSSDGELVPEAGLAGGLIADGLGTNWFLKVSPLANQVGTANITVTVTNDAGLSADAALNITVVIPLDVTNSFFPDTNLLSWGTGGQAPWFGQTNVYHERLPAAQTGSITDNGDSWLEASMTGRGW